MLRLNSLRKSFIFNGLILKSELLFVMLVSGWGDMSSASETISQVVAGLRSIGYNGPLLEKDYKFLDWFSPLVGEWKVDAAAFAQTPISYDSACIGVVHANGLCRESLINKCRALGAPIILEVDGAEIREWSVSRRREPSWIGGHIQLESLA